MTGIKKLDQHCVYSMQSVLIDKLMKDKSFNFGRMCKICKTKPNSLDCTAKMTYVGLEKPFLSPLSEDVRIVGRFEVPDCPNCDIESQKTRYFDMYLDGKREVKEDTRKGE